MKEKDSTTLQRIMEEGKKEFLEKGFKDASLRNIVKSAGVTTGASYVYYPDKKALFDALVSTAANGLKEVFLSEQKDFDGLSKETKQETVLEDSAGGFDRFVAYIYEHFDEFKLLFTCAEGTAFSDFTHSLVELEVEYTLKFIESTGNDCILSGRASPELFHIISSAFFSGVFEIIKHDMTKEAADIYISQLKHFYLIGWDSIFNSKS